MAALDGEPRRVLWSMVPAGEPTEDRLTTLGELVDQGDLLVDGANSNYRDFAAPRARLAGAGAVSSTPASAAVSGAAPRVTASWWAARRTTSARSSRSLPPWPAHGWAHLGPVGAGHFTKMVHNGVEYSLIQAYAEGYELLAAADVDIDLSASTEVWRHGSVVHSWLLNLLADTLTKDPELASAKRWTEESRVVSPGPFGFRTSGNGFRRHDGGIP